MKRIALAVLVVIVASASSASADIISTSSTSGNLTIVPAPASVEIDALESDLNLFIFVEQQSLLLPTDLRVNFTEPQLYDERDDLPFPVPTIAAGTLVDSYFMHSDPATGRVRFAGSITFDTDVLGVILGGVLLDESDAIVGATGTTYEPDFFGAGRGLAIGGQDSIELTANRRVLKFAFVTRQLMDEVRVITAPQAVPEPATLALLSGGLAMLSMRRRRRRG